MKAEVVYIDILIFNETNLKLSTICEILLFECSSAEQVAVVIPFGDRDGESDGDTIILKKSDIEIYSYDAKEKWVHIFVSENCKMDFLNGGNCKTLSFHLVPQPFSKSNSSKSDLNLFLNFCMKNFHGVKCKPTKWSDFLSSELLKNLGETYSDGVTLWDSLYERRVKALFRSYVYFFNYTQMNEHGFKKFMRSQENLPKFLKEILMVEDLNSYFWILCDFLRSHICGICGKATHKKCSGCRFVGACSMKCQSQSWEKQHGERCSIEAYRRNWYNKSRQTMMNQLFKQFSNGIVPVSLDVFLRELLDSVYVACIPDMEAGSLDEWIELYFKDRPKSKWIVEIKSLKKKQYDQMYRKLSLGKIAFQMMEAWGVGTVVNVDSLHD